MKQRIYLIGASGAGVSTLGAALARHLRLPHVDVDEHYWLPSDPPFLQARPPEQRLERLRQALGEAPWVVSGSMDGWGDAIIARADRVLYLDTPTALRLQRIAVRERQRFGPRILPGGDMHHQHLAFLEWAAAYDSGARAGRSRPRHDAWLAQLQQPWERLDGRCSEEELLARALLILGQVQTAAKAP
ncbi:adenylate kinase [Pseudomonas sp. Au-Pse12]|uniref:adenylate kinase n=1 Tax=Pseudomonas sp. Au-Pse12 TaxID=2906459 RepID=UPI001E5D4F6B|nr:adenylate kinase [Pseudomonas sp. Au-Pse12]MCE4057274.1 adenylate kinase [Pseudomonas sp. Au-Pse12]